MIQQKKFDPMAIENMNLSLVQFKSEYNGACQIVSMIYNDLERTYKGIVDFYTVDFEIETIISETFGVREIPTILFFKNGQLVDHSIGLVPKNELKDKIENALFNSKNI
ncbi:MAG: thioredoxin domain-containing protein [Ferruginibacter sp.]